MGDKDSKLIFESYKNSFLINESWKTVLGSTVLPAMGYLGAKTGITDKVVDRLEKQGIPVEKFLESWVGVLTRFFDPTGVTSWPALQEAENAYKANPNDEESAIQWWSEFFSIIPVVGAMFKKIMGAIGVVTGGRFVMGFLKKIIYYISKDKKTQSLTRIGIKRWVENYKKYNEPKTERSKEYSEKLESIIVFLIAVYGRGSIQFLNEFTGLPQEVYDYVARTLNSAPDNTPTSKEQQTTSTETDNPEQNMAQAQESPAGISSLDQFFQPQPTRRK